MEVRFKDSPLYNSDAMVPPGGSAGQVLTKESDSDYSVHWEDLADGPSYIAGDGMSLDGDTFSVDTPVRGIYTKAQWDAIPEEQRSKGAYVVSDGLPSSGGVTFTPSVSQDGTLSWTNNGNLDNPEPVNIKGPQGQAGANATINGQNTLTIAAGQNVSLSQSGSTMTVGVPAPEVYSTEDTRIGTWIDGKPLYRRVIITTVSDEIATGKEIIITPNPQADTFVKVYGFWTRPTTYGKYAYFIGSPPINANGNIVLDDGYNGYVWAAGSDRTNKIFLYGCGNAVNKPLTIIIEYTKTTDQATIQTTAMSVSLTAEPAAASAVKSKEVTA